MARQASAEGPQAGLSRTTILLLAWFMVGMAAGIPAPYHVFCIAVGLLSVVVYVALELAAFQRAALEGPPDEEVAEVEAEQEGSPRREQRRSLRYAVPAEQQEATLKVGQAKIQVRLVNVSSGGFGVWVERDPGVEAGQVVWIRTDAGWDEVRVIEALPESEGFRIRLQICSAVKPWSHIREEQYRKIRSRRLRKSAKIPVVAGVMTALVIVLAPFVRHALLSGRHVPVATVGSGQRAVDGPKVAAQHLARQEGAASRNGAPQPRGSAGVIVTPQSDSGNRAVADAARPEREKRATPGTAEQEHPSLPPSGEGNAPAGDASSSIHQKLTEAINSVLEDLGERSAKQPLLVEVIRGEAEEGPAASEAPSAKAATMAQRKRSESLASFDRGLQSFWKAEHERAIAAFGQAIAQWPDDPAYHYFLALSQYLAGQREQADESLAAAVALEAKHPAPDLGRLLQRVQGPHRRWLQAARIKGQVGPYRPRR